MWKLLHWLSVSESWPCKLIRLSSLCFSRMITTCFNIILAVISDFHSIDILSLKNVSVFQCASSQWFSVIIDKLLAERENIVFGLSCLCAIKDNLGLIEVTSYSAHCNEASSERNLKGQPLLIINKTQNLHGLNKCLHCWYVKFSLYKHFKVVVPG